MNTTRLRTTILLLLAALATYGTIAGSSQPVIELFQGMWIAELMHRLHIGNEIVFVLSSGVLVSIFFWYLIVYLPQCTRKKILKSTFQRHYRYFKEDVIEILLSASEEPFDGETEEDLMDHASFRAYYNADNKRRWYAMLYGLERNPEKIEDLLVEMDLLREEVAYLLHNIELENETAHAFFKRLTAHLYKLRNLSVYTNDHVKYLGSFILELFAGWSVIDGYSNRDPVQDMIDSI